MAKSSRPAKRRVPFSPNDPTPERDKSRSPTSISYRNFLRILFFTIVLGGGSLAIFLRGGGGFLTNVPRYTFTVLNKFPHDAEAFTQGLIFDESGTFLFESTGLLGQSSFRKVDLVTGNILKQVPLQPDQFGEGLTKLNGRFYQLTWRNDQILIYDEEMNLLETKTFDSEMWGLTNDGENLIISDGTSRLTYLDPESLAQVKVVYCRIDNGSAGFLNELEYSKGKIYANKYQTDLIYEIDAATSRVTALIDLTGLWPTNVRPVDGMLNGIAVNDQRQHLFVTGKLCPFIYEIELKFRD